MKRIVSLIMALSLLLSVFPLTALAASTPEEAMGKVNIYSGGYSMQYLAVNGQVQTGARRAEAGQPAPGILCREDCPLVLSDPQLGHLKSDRESVPFRRGAGKGGAHQGRRRGHLYPRHDLGQSAHTANHRCP